MHFLLTTAQKRGISLYIVGGFVRDILLGRDSYDLDMVTTMNPRALGLEIAEHAGGHYFELNVEHATSRIYLVHEGTDWEVDVGPLKGRNIMEDLQKRDFTVNAMGISIEDFSRKKDWWNYVLDPTGGRTDLQKRLLRVTGEEALHKDPIRILRGIRLSSKLDFLIEEKTVQLFETNRALLSGVAGERLKLEMGRLLEKPAARSFEQMYHLQLMEELLPPLGELMERSWKYYSPRGLEHSLLTLNYFESITDDMPFPMHWEKMLQLYLDKKVKGGWKVRQILKLAAFLHNIVGYSAVPPDKNTGEVLQRKEAGYVRNYSRRLHMSREEEKKLDRFVLYYIYPLWLYRVPHRTGGTLYGFYRALGTDTPGILLLSLVDYYALWDLLPAREKEYLPSPREYKKFIDNLLYRYFFEEERYVRPPSLIAGSEIMDRLGIDEGPLVGWILEIIAEAQAEGTVTTRKEAIDLAKKEYRSIRNGKERIGRSV